MSDRWFYADGGQALGPESLEGMVSIFSRKPDWRQVLVWSDGYEGWKRAEDVSDISSQMVQMPPPLPPPLPRETIGDGPIVESEYTHRLDVIRQSVAARVLVLFGLIVVIAAIVTWNMMTPAGHSALMLKLTGLLGPAVIVGGIWGWIKYSRSSWLWATLIVAFLTIVLMLLNPDTFGVRF